MSYRVEYASSGIKRKQIRQRRDRALLVTAVCFLIFLLIAGLHLMRELDTFLKKDKEEREEERYRGERKRNK